MFDKRVNKFQREFSVPLMSSGSQSFSTKQSRLELDVIIGKVEKRKWRVVKTYTQGKIVAIATGTMYKKPKGRKLKKTKQLLGGEEPPWTAEHNWRDHSEVEVESDGEEREAVVDVVRKLSLDIYEDKTKMFGIDADTVFTQIMLGFIVGGDVPPPHPVEDPYQRLRDEMRVDFYKNTNIDVHRKV